MNGKLPPFPWVWARIVKAVDGPVAETSPLSPSDKLVYCELMALCEKRSGTKTGAGALGRRLGLKAKTIEGIRTKLMQFGLLERRGGNPRSGTTASWVPTMPESCRPAYRRIDEDQLAEFATRLACLILAKRAQTTPPARGGPTKQPVERGKGWGTPPWEHRELSPHSSATDGYDGYDGR